MIALSRLRTEAQILATSVGVKRGSGLHTKPTKNMQNAWIAPPNMNDLRRPRESARKKMKIKHVTTLTTP
jgi:hypothetical protein